MNTTVKTKHFNSIGVVIQSLFDHGQSRNNQMLYILNWRDRVHVYYVYSIPEKSEFFGNQFTDDKKLFIEAHQLCDNRARIFSFCNMLKPDKNLLFLKKKYKEISSLLKNLTGSSINCIT